MTITKNLYLSFLLKKENAILHHKMSLFEINFQNVPRDMEGSLCLPLPSVKRLSETYNSFNFVVLGSHLLYFSKVNR